MGENIIECDWHSRYRYMAGVRAPTGEVWRRQKEHENGQARVFCAIRPPEAIVGTETTFLAAGLLDGFPACGLSFTFSLGMEFRLGSSGL